MVVAVGGGGVERDLVRGLEVWMELELEMKLGYVGACVASAWLLKVGV